MPPNQAATMARARNALLPNLAIRTAQPIQTTRAARSSTVAPVASRNLWRRWPPVATTRPAPANGIVNPSGSGDAGR
eukprot:11168648-Lingulodinium_polyedra.AAC.1